MKPILKHINSGIICCIGHIQYFESKLAYCVIIVNHGYNLYIAFATTAMINLIQ
jgi:hypothetical protein